jgi:anti-sigma B factor antagonist
MLNSTVKEENGNTIVELEGRIDALSAVNFRKVMESILPCSNYLTLDVKKVEYISSAGLSVILAAQQYMESQDLPDVKVMNINPSVKEIFMMTGFDELVDAEM